MRPTVVLLALLLPVHAVAADPPDCEPLAPKRLRELARLPTGPSFFYSRGSAGVQASFCDEAESTSVCDLGATLAALRTAIGTKTMRSSTDELQVGYLFARTRTRTLWDGFAELEPERVACGDATCCRTRWLTVLSFVGPWVTLRVRGASSDGGNVTAHGETWQTFDVRTGAEVSAEELAPASALLAALAADGALAAHAEPGALAAAKSLAELSAAVRDGYRVNLAGAFALVDYDPATKRAAVRFPVDADGADHPQIGVWVEVRPEAVTALRETKVNHRGLFFDGRR